MTDEKQTKTEVKKEVKEAILVSVPSGYTDAIQLEDGSYVDTEQLLIRIYNKLLKIEKSVA